VKTVVVGGGILGVATARLAALAGDAVVLLEKEPDLALHQTGRNSGVVHGGLYYVPGSLKARLCRRGGGLVRDYCRDRDLPYDECGKLVVAASTDELARLDALEARARDNGVPDLRRLDAAGLRAVEPAVGGVAGLHAPRTAITDFAAVTRAMADDAVAAGASIRTSSAVRRVTTGRVGSAGARTRVELVDGTAVDADRVIVCGGLHADRLAHDSGQPRAPRIVPFRGEYRRLRDGREWLVRGLIYPVPDPALPFLGVHFTRKVDGSIWIGPNAVPATAREGYRWTDRRCRDVHDAYLWPGALRLARRHWRFGVGEIGRAASRRAYVRDARRYVPALRPGDVVPAPSGVRAQAVDADGTLVDDFRLGRDGAVLWVRNAPSPAATASMAIAEELLG